MLVRGLKILKSKRAVATIVLGMAFFCFCAVLVPEFAVAQSQDVVTEGVKVIEKPLGLPSTDIRLIVARIIRTALGLIGIILVCIVIYGGFLWMTAGGNEEQIGKAKKVLINAAIGLALILSAYSIVSFVIRMLGVADGFNYGSGGAQSPGIQRFDGSGALGRTIKDHYPRRDQIDVPRNSKIIISLKKPILLDELYINDNDNNKVFGNCRETMINWETDCDTLKLSDDHINIKETKSGTSIKTAAIMISTSTVGNQTGIYTLVLRPITTDTNGGYLGSNSEKISYTVYLGNKILLDNLAGPNTPAFANLSGSHYKWNFVTDLKLDKSPPTVKSVYPNHQSVSVKNTVIQIEFSEPMDPSGIQGTFSSGGNHYYLNGKNLFLISKNSKIPAGSFELLNNYRTLEFSSSYECGKNACGRPIYCLPVCEPNKSSCATVEKIVKNGQTIDVKGDLYEMLLKTGKPINTQSFEAIPFSGFMDASGNALDGNADNKIDDPNKPTPNYGSGFPASINFDSYYWKFTVKDTIDSTAPYLRQIWPSINVGSVKMDELWQMMFSKRMRINSLYTIDIKESPPKNVNVKYPIWYSVDRVSFMTNNYTSTTMMHGKFLTDTDYYPIIDSQVEDANYNCLYPAKGPAAPGVGNASAVCQGTTNCTNVQTGDLFCNDVNNMKQTSLGYNSTKCVSDLVKQMGKNSSMLSQ